MSTDFPEPRFIDANGIRLALYERDGDPNRKRPPLILVHGWPEIAFSWNRQIGAFADAGFRTIALDLKGFGRSDAPADAGLYDMAHMTGDLAALLDAVGAEKAIFCGHDWGGAIVWGMAQLRPERVAGVISLCTPVSARPPVPPLSIIKRRLSEKHYFIQFQEPDIPEALFESDIERFFRTSFLGPAPREKWPALIPAVYDVPGRFKTSKGKPPRPLVIPEDALGVYIDAYRKSGFKGGINLYRNIDRNWAMMEGRNETVRAPSLWIGAELDIFLPPETADGMEKIVPDLEKHVVAGSGHWIMWEKPDDVNALVADWLKRRFHL